MVNELLIARRSQGATVAAIAATAINTTTIPSAVLKLRFRSDMAVQPPGFVALNTGDSVAVWSTGTSGRKLMQHLQTENGQVAWRVRT
jgi:hypothetical protein